MLRRGPGVDTVQVWIPAGRTLAYPSHQAVAGQGVAETDRLATEQAGLLCGFAPTPQADVPAADDTAVMNRLLPQQWDLSSGGSSGHR